MATVSDNVEHSRFELEEDGMSSIAAYELSGDRIVFTHTVVPPELRGRGVAARLVAGALAQAQARSLKVVPRCSYVAHYMATHPETQNLLAGDIA